MNQEIISWSNTNLFLWTSIIRIVWQTVKKIINEIVGIKGLNFSNLPHGPAARSPASGLNGRIRVATTFTHVGILYCNSAGFSEKPQESAKIRCWTLEGCFNVYELARKPPKLCPRRTNFSNPISCRHCSIDVTNCSSASCGSPLSCGRELRPNPNRSIAYTVLCFAKASMFSAHRPAPPPKPWIITSGTLVALGLNFKVHILSLFSTGTCLPS